MDVTYSTLAFGDAIHDFKEFAIMYKSQIQDGLPGNVLNIDGMIDIDEIEDTLLAINAARSNDIDTLEFSSPQELHTNLCDGSETFGLIGDANGAMRIIDFLERGDKEYYILVNRETLCDSANTPKHEHVSKGYVAKDTNEIDILYPKWSLDLCMSSKFCSNYNFSIKYITNTELKYYAGTDDFTINSSRIALNPNNKPNIIAFIHSTTSGEQCSIAFQRKRSGDWFQALSALDGDRLYTLRDGTVKKLTMPLYFCTEDRVAAAYAIAIGANTIFFQKGTKGHFVYKNHISPQMDAFCRNSFDTDKVPEYKEVIANAVSVYDIRHTMLVEELTSRTPNTSAEIVQYIGYIYSYVLLEDRLGTVLNLHKELIGRFMSASLTPSEQHTVYKIYQTSLTHVPILLSHNIHSTTAFPSLPTVSPISDSAVQPSDVYIAGLLHDFKRVPSVLPYVTKCVRKILELSPSDELRLHYSTLEAEHSGGFVTREQPKIQLQYMCRFYIAYLKNAITTFKRLNEIRQGLAGSHGTGDVEVCYANLVYIVQKTGIMKKEFQDYERFVQLKEESLEH